MTTASLDIAARRTLAETVAQRAGALALEYFRGRDRLSIETKRSAADLVSEADRNVELLIRRAISEAFPEDGLLGEEHGARPGSSGLTWAIDPIDGTAPFLAGLPGWCVSIGAFDAQGPVLGVIHVPVLDELFTAARGEEAALNGAPLRLAPGAGLSNGMLGIGANDRVPEPRVSEMLSALTRAGANWVRYGSGALMLAYVAAGRLIGYVEPRMCAWDCIAGYCLIEAAGGRALPFDGGPQMQEAAPVLGAQAGVYDELSRLCRFHDLSYWGDTSPVG